VGYGQTRTLLRHRKSGGQQLRTYGWAHRWVLSSTSLAVSPRAGARRHRWCRRRHRAEDL